MSIKRQPVANVLGTTSAKYNLLSRESWCTDIPRWDPPVAMKEQVGLATAFNSSRAIYLNRSVDYRIPVRGSSTYYVYLGLLTNDKKTPGESILKLTVNGHSQLLDLGILGPGNPGLVEFAVTPEEGSIHISSECDASSMSMYRDCFINGIWLFESAVDRDELKTGRLDRLALVHIACGREQLTDAAAIVDLEFEPRSFDGQHLFLPYNLPVHEAPRASGISPSAAQAAVREHWDGLLGNGAQLKTGVPR